MKKTNKGFSMVELIIVIAIMAILAGALAPALIKYINKSRLSTDVSNAQTIATAVNTAIANEGAYDEVGGIDTTFSVTDKTTAPTGKACFDKEFMSALGNKGFKSKAKKDMNGTQIPVQGYLVEMKFKSGDDLKVYVGTTASASREAYPQVAKELTEATK